jgi:hypothetical protein
VLAHPPREHEVPPHLFAHLAARDLHAFAVVDVPVAVLHERAAEDALEVALAARKAATLAIAQDANRFLPLQCCESVFVVVRSEQDVDEALGQRFAEGGGDRAVQRADHPERRHRVRGERAVVRLFDRARDGDTARVRVLHDHTCG